MTQKSELTLKNESYPVEYADIPSSEVEGNPSIQKLVFEKLHTDAKVFELEVEAAIAEATL